MRIICGLTLSLTLAGCAGYVQGDGGGVVMAEPDVSACSAATAVGGTTAITGGEERESRGGAPGRSVPAAATPSGGRAFRSSPRRGRRLDGGRRR